MYYNLPTIRHKQIQIVICITRLRSHSLTYREKNCRRGRLRPRQEQPRGC
jgi:hypothetical protein